MQERKSHLVQHALENQRQPGEHTPLKDPSWSYVNTRKLDDFSREDWALLGRQRQPYEIEERPKQALEMLIAQQDIPSFGYQINNYQHCLQSATKAMEDGQDDETIVVALFHDVGFMVCNDTHGAFSAELLRPYVHDKHIWTLQRHMYFQFKHLPTVDGIDHDFRDRWRNHDYYDWAASFVEKYDIEAMNADFTNAPLEEFIPIVNRVFAKSRQPICPPE